MESNKEYARHKNDRGSNRCPSQSIDHLTLPKKTVRELMNHLITTQHQCHPAMPFAASGMTRRAVNFIKACFTA
jgi:hypothetical protein